MTRLLPANERGLTKLAWLNSFHSFSFNNFYDPNRVHFGPLRVVNDDRVVPGAGFGAHPHDNMEIVTYVIEGALEHRDNAGGHGIIRAGDVQRMRAGTGIVHSEYNNSATEPVHFYQIWFFPDIENLEPGYEQQSFTPQQRKNTLLTVASPDMDVDGVHIRTEARMFIGTIDAGKSVAHSLLPTHGAYIMITAGTATINGTKAGTGDAVTIEGESSVTISAETDAEVMMFDVAV